MSPWAVLFGVPCRCHIWRCRISNQLSCVARTWIPWPSVYTPQLQCEYHGKQPSSLCVQGALTGNFHYGTWQRSGSFCGNCFPYAGQRSLFRRSCLLPQFQNSRFRLGPALPSCCFVLLLSTALTVVVGLLSSTIFIWVAMLSAAWHISSVCCRVSLASLSRRSLSRIPNTNRSHNISSGVIVSKSQFSAIFLSAVRYWSYVSPGSCVRQLKRYRSNGMFLHGWQYCSNLVSTGSIFASSPAYSQSENVEKTSRASSPITVNSLDCLGFLAEPRC